MRKFLTALARFFAVVCAITFVITLVPALILANAENQLFKAETYTRALETTGTYERLPVLISQHIITNLTMRPCQERPLGCLPEEATELRACMADSLGAEAFSALSNDERPASETEQAAIQGCIDQFGAPYTPSPDEQSQAPEYLKYLTLKDWENLITTLITPRQAREITEQTLNGIFDYLNGKSDSVTISLLPIKEKLAQNSAQAVKQVLAAQPDCTADQLVTLTAELTNPDESEGGGNVWCNPPAEAMPVLDPLIGELFQDRTAQMPDSVPVFTKEQGKDILPRIDVARWIMRLSLLIPLAFLLLMTLLAVRSRESWLRWWSLPLISAGALGLLTGILIEPVTRFILTTQAPRIPAQMARFVEATLDLMLAVTREISNPVMLYSGLILAAGIAMMALARYIANKKPAAEQAA